MAAKKHKVLWEDSGLRFDHVPFVVVNHKVYDCQHGVDRHLCEKKRNQGVSWNRFVFKEWKLIFRAWIGMRDESLERR